MRLAAATWGFARVLSEVSASLDPEPLMTGNLCGLFINRIDARESRPAATPSNESLHGRDVTLHMREHAAVDFVAHEPEHPESLCFPAGTLAEGDALHATSNPQRHRVSVHHGLTFVGFDVSTVTTYDNFSPTHVPTLRAWG